MHERFRKRLEALEELHKQLSEPSLILAIRFINPDRTPVEAVVATDQKGFICHCGKDESLDDFTERAINELRALHPVGPPCALIFSAHEDKEPLDAA
jgi:hypothetical protein